MKPFCLAFAVLFLSAFAFADVIPDNSHPFDRCIRVSNMQQFPNVTLVGSITGPAIHGNPEIYVVKPGDCLYAGYKFNVLALYWTPSSNIVSTGTAPVIIDNSQAHLLMKDIQPNGGYVSNSDPRSGETVEYELVRNADGSLSLNNEQTTTAYLNGSSTNKSDQAGNNTNPIQPLPPEKKGFFESIMCFFIQIFGGRC